MKCDEDMNRNKNRIHEADNILPESKVPADLLWDHRYDAGKLQVLIYGIDFKVFNHLAEPISGDEVARILNTKAEPTSHLLDMLAIIGVITKKNDRYVNTALAEEYLVAGKPTYLGDMYAMGVKSFDRILADFPQVLKSGISEERQLYSEDYYSNITEMYARSQRAMWSYRALPLIIEMPEFPTFKRMLDLGGNAGVLTMALVSRHPTLKGTVLDRPHVVEKTKQIIQEYGLQNRIDTKGADFTKDDFGSDYDLIWATNCLTPQDNLDSIFERAYKSMNAGGICISQHPVVNRDRTWPQNAAWWFHVNAIAGQDETCYETTFSDAMLKAGFRSVESRYVNDYWSIDRVDIARKEKKK